MAQENMGDWMEYAREYAKAQREMKIEKWVCITIEYRTKERQRVVLFLVEDGGAGVKADSEKMSGQF